MHNAPSVTYAMTRSAVALVLPASIWLASVAVTALWIHSVDAPGWQRALVLCTLCFVGCSAGWAWHRTAASTLKWDGRAWSWTPDAISANPDTATEGSVAVSIDLQRVMLVQWRGNAADRRSTCWLWLERSSCPARWNDLRRAVHANASHDAMSPSTSATATP